jgi:membrane-bound lytic murein transglycosylase D
MFQKKLFRTGLPFCFMLVISGVHSQSEQAAYSYRLLNPPDTTSTESPVVSSSVTDPGDNAMPFVTLYIKKNRYGLVKLKKRSEKYFSIIEPVLERYEIPAELKYLAVVESAFNTTLVSNRGAAGLWQLMPVTASQLGLKVNEESDERFNIHKSTVASAKYLKKLYKEFGDWLLVVAAYNSGPGHVSRAIRISGSRDFWQLQHLLPAQTRNHVKKFISVQYYFESES